jgi:carboxymethylenebutenolidase
MTTVDLTRTDTRVLDVPGISPWLSGYLALPDGPGPWPGVVVIHEALGADDVMRRATDRLAAAGYLAVLPDLFTAGRKLPCLISTFRALRSGEGRAFADLEVTRQWLLARPDCTGRVGVLGFCMGGGFALLLAGRGYDAAAPNYGMLPADLDAALDGACPVVASYGGKDRGLRGAADRLETALQRAGIPHDVVEYPNAGHSFLNDAENAPKPLRPLMRVMNVGPEPASAAQAWARIERFFAVHLAGPNAQP